MTETAKITFWGVRGSIPAPERENARYGGNTPCVEVEMARGERFVLDCGTGLRALGNQWMADRASVKVNAHILVTHYHWDHVQGIPFFAPLFAPENHFHFHGFRSALLGAGSMRQAFEQQMAQAYFPADASAVTAVREFSEVRAGQELAIGTIRVTTRALNHPGGCLGFRLDAPAGAIVYATDYEPGLGEYDAALRELAADADVLIADAQYAPEQLAGMRKGWGHSSWLDSVRLAQDAGAKNLILFHHDPESADKTVDGFVRQARRNFANVWAAAEGMEITLSDRHVEVQTRETRMLTPA